MPYYAWSNITATKDKAGRPIVIPAGTEISLESSGFTPEQFQELVDTRAVQQIPYPPLAKGSTLSPADFYRRQAAVAEGRVDADVMAEAAIVRMPEWQTEPSASTLMVPEPITSVNVPADVQVVVDAAPIAQPEIPPQSEAQQQETQQEGGTPQAHEEQVDVSALTGEKPESEVRIGE